MEEQDRITKEHLKSAVANEFSVKSDEVEIINFEGSAGCATGDNFATVVRLIDFKYKLNGGEEKSHSYIVKQIPFNEFRAKIIKEGPIWKKEVIFYSQLMEKMQKIRRSFDQSDLPFAKCFLASDEDGVLVMENLKTKGYKTVPKSAEGIPEALLIKVLTEIAHFHATTYHYLQQYPGGIETLQKEEPSLCLESFYDAVGNDPKIKEMLLGSHHSMFLNSAKVIQEYAKDDDLYQRLNKFVDGDWSGRLGDAQKPRSNFRVITHGDLWYMNFMFRNNEDGTIKDVILIDLQIMRVANPSVDLVYLLCSSSNNAARKESLTTWLKIYHDTLIEDLKLLGYSKDVYPFEELEKDVGHAFPFGTFLGIMHAQVLQITDKADFDMDAITEDNMAEMMEKMGKLLIERSLKNEGLCNRLLGLAEEAKSRNVI